MTVYFDNAATTRPREEAADAMLRVMRGEYGNPSSPHFMGRAAKSELESARNHVARALGAETGEIYFTSGGTEADNWAVLGAAELRFRAGKHIITSAIEHDAIRKPIKKLENRGFSVTYLDPDGDGQINPEAFAAALREDTVLATVMLVNNETGVINPIGEFAREIKMRGFKTLLHTDAVQGFCKIPFTVKALGADLLTVSSHKIHGPKGAGALYIKKSVKLPSLISGGSQEGGRRAGTEGTPAVAGFGEASRLGLLELEGNAANALALREFIISRLSELLPEAVVIGTCCSPYLLNLSLPGHRSEVLMSFLEGEGICVSKSAACGKGARSHVLEAMRLKNSVIDGAIRISFSRYNTIDECEYFVQALKNASVRLFRPMTN